MAAVAIKEAVSSAGQAPVAVIAEVMPQAAGHKEATHLAAVMARAEVARRVRVREPSEALVDTTRLEPGRNVDPGHGRSAEKDEETIAEAADGEVMGTAGAGIAATDDGISGLRGSAATCTLIATMPAIGIAIARAGTTATAPTIATGTAKIYALGEAAIITPASARAAPYLCAGRGRAREGHIFTPMSVSLQFIGVSNDHEKDVYPMRGLR